MLPSPSQQQRHPPRRFIIHPSRWQAVVVGVALLIAGSYLRYEAADPERLDLTESVRASAPGRFVRLTDGYTHYEVDGPANGPPVVLVAGFSVPYYIWDPTFQALTAAGFHVLRYDYYGRGYSDRPNVAYTDDFYVRQLHELLDAVHITKPVDLAGLSMGGGVVTSFADRYPDRVRSLIYFDPSFRTPHATSLIEDQPAVWDFLTVVLEERLWADSQLEDFFQPARFPDWPQRYRDQMQYHGFRRARLSELVSNASADQTEQLKHVSEHPRPVLVVWGKEDKSVPFAQSEALLELMPRARFLAVGSAGHLPQLEQPAIVNAALIEFLRALGGGSIPATR